MPRRVSLPGAAELFRATGDTNEPATPQATPTDVIERSDSVQPAQAVQSEPAAPGRGTGRVRHDEKITVYVSADELLALEQARLTIRARYRVAVDRGRIVREAVAALLADLEANGAESELMRRLRGS